MKYRHSALVLFFFSIAGLAAQQPSPNSPAPAPYPAPGASVLPPTPGTLPAAPAADVPPNPLGAPAPTAIDIKLPDPASSTAADDTPDPNTPMEKAFFPNTEIKDIIQTVANGYKLNVIIPESLTGVATIALRHVTWKQIFSHVLDPVGFTYVMDDNIIVIKLKTDVATDPMVTQVIPVNSAKAVDLAKSLVQFLDTKGTPPETILPDDRTNQLIVTAHPSKMSNLQEAIERLDQPTPQVAIEAKFIELNANDDKNLGILWNFNGTQLGAADLAWQYNLLHGLGAINQSGTIPGSSGSGLGVQSLAQTIDGAAASSITAPANQNLNEAQPTAALAANIPSSNRRAADLAFFNQAEYAATLVAMQNIANARLVSSPKGVTLDNKELTLFSGTNITIVFPTVNNQTGQTTPGQITNYLIGITLRVTPHVTNGGFINLTLNPELSRIDPQQDTYFGATYPRIDSRKLTDTNVSIKDGYTLAIGGLIDDQDSKTTTQVPILGDLPVIGNLFRSTETIRQRNNLIIFITAKTLNKDGATYRDVISPEMMIRTGITAQDLPGYYDNTRAVDAPNMKYASPEEQAKMEEVQNLRDEADLLQRMQELQQENQDAKGGIPDKKDSTPSSSSTSGGVTRH